MKLNRLLSILPEISSENLTQDAQVAGVFNDARLVTPGSVFVAIKGSALDGHKFIPDAVSKGALALVVEDRALVPTNFSGVVIQVQNSRTALDLLASRFYLDPGQELFCIGVTGTNGKTSVTYMTEAILNAGHIPTGVVGTINHHLKDKIWASEMTTPDPVFLQKRLREFRDEGALAAALEVSSHALDQKRVDSVPFNTVIFTNLTRDHLDYHKDMDNYFEAKQRLFTDLLWKTPKSPCYAIVNTADKYGRRLQIAGPAVLWTYGDKDSDLRYQIKKMDFALTHFTVDTPRGSGEVLLPMSGVHNVLNALAALGAGLSAGLSLEICIQALNNFTGVPGRLQSVPNQKELSVFVDYAHSPDALENVLKSLNQVRENLKSSARIWTIFGCGGDRDKGKRPLMAQMALKYSDQVVITSDNPRTEDPQSIINEILTGVTAADKDKTSAILDREEAIRSTIKKAAPGDVILIAGKGHEDYQIIGKEKRPFSDVGVAEKALQERSV
ncbi:UDP-N-acetylmuramoyl-L-alanyl-D-glutamate--2,6-diaminopimelate ligase [Bdellovibrio bacteriovorus]|uniref:UDP-N-acetylmuramoyl-L-alanyl-D-glutamate--2,6-diaminopimelate ligase n=1 Tax=Bdellovibrio bacteriovorus TaxID=959 RepID=A0A150WNX3_BDEBC|nr:UDP-N-acetylmuramoyl-L-alanyl-D-glutamate--2,6-diaminopimelate ligase [Bdellovibrio bacteriovorus]KYG66066.1 UDP-N-acetylmuramoyl-L-alanyl-D-glutamate--2,6-diaminopimelate ligase [Bdellovibrio bacteriovorus]